MFCYISFMNRLYIFCGYPFAGKSRLAKSLKNKYGFVSVYMEKIYKESDKSSVQIDWEEAFKLYYSRIEENLLKGKTIIADSVGYNKKGREDLKQLANKIKAEPCVVCINTPLETVKERLLRNKQTVERHDVEVEEFNKIVNNFEPPTRDENVIPITPEMNIEEIYNFFA